jgi:hypothetical protein
VVAEFKDDTVNLQFVHHYRFANTRRAGVSQ